MEHSKTWRPLLNNTVYLDLVRHGESETNADGTRAGGNDTRLTECGKIQARLVGRAYVEYCQPICHLWHSTLIRASETADILAREFADPSLKITSSNFLIERQHPEWEGKPYSEIDTPETIARMNLLGPDFTPPGGESFRDVERRMATWLGRTIKNGDTPTRIVAVSHGHAIKCLLWHILRFDASFIWRIKIDNASITRLRWTDAGWFLDALNDVSHLRVPE